MVLDHPYNIPNTSNLPTEKIYADDADFLSISEHQKDVNTTQIGSILLRRNLLVNDDKTENTVFRRDTRINEPWRMSKKLGSLLGDSEDIQRRKNLAIAASCKLNKIWIGKSKVSLKRRLHLYNSLVKPVLLYNCETWGLSKSEAEKLDSFHRKQLRRVLNILYPNRISNQKLYNRCETNEIRLEILKRRWTFFGHV